MPSVRDRILSALLPEYAGLRADVNALQAQGAYLMATVEQFNERMTQIDVATTEIANDLKALRDQLASGTIPDSALATLDEKIATLTKLGADPQNPVPEPAPSEPGEPA